MASQAVIEKAERITITETRNPRILKASSGTHENVSYMVEHNGVWCTRCACQSRVECCHMVAGDLYLALKAKQAKEDAFRYYELAMGI